MSFIEKFTKTKRRLIIISSIVILCIVLGGIGVSKYANAVQIKEGLSLGNKYLQEGKYEEAILDFQKVIKIDPKNIEARVSLAKAYVKTGSQAEAEKVLKEAISIAPKRVEPYLELANLYITENNLVNALKVLNEGYKATNDDKIKAMLEDLKSKITLADINKTIILGENYSVPNEVTVKINNIEVQFPVKWDASAVDTTKVGITIYTGTLENTDKLVKLTLNVIGIASIGDINNTIKQNDKYSLPAKVTAKMTDGSTQEVSVKWNSSSIDTSKAGNYSYQGTVNGYSSKVKLTLNIQIQGIRLGELRKQLFGNRYAVQGKDVAENISRQEWEEHMNDKYKNVVDSYFVSVGSIIPSDPDDKIIEPDITINGKLAFKVYYKPVTAYYSSGNAYGLEIVDLDGKIYNFSEVEEANKNNKVFDTSGKVLVLGFHDLANYFTLEW